MAKEDNRLSGDTSYNKYSKFNTSAVDTSIDTSASWPMSPYYLFSTAEMALLCKKRPVTVCLEARRRKIGTKKDGKWYFNEDERLKLIESFAHKRQPQTTTIPPDNISLLANILQRQDFLARAVTLLRKENETIMHTLWDVQQKYLEWLEELPCKQKRGGQCEVVPKNREGDGRPAIGPGGGGHNETP